MSSDLVAAPEVRRTVSHSEVESYLRCERQHYYGYGIGIQRVQESDSLTRGILGHSALEKFFRGLLNGKSFDEAWDEMILFVAQQAMKYPLLVPEILDCLKWFKVAYPFHGWTVLAVEQEYILEVNDDLAMPFVVDLIIEDPYHETWMIDHKFVYDFVSDRDAELMPQIAKYVAAMKVLGIRIDHAAFSSLRYRSLKNPEAENKYQLTKVPLTIERLRQTMLEQLYASQRIQDRKRLPIEEQSKSALRTANKMVCNSCSFRSLCIAELNNHQPRLVLDSEYVKRERREFNTHQIEPGFKEIEVD